MDVGCYGFIFLLLYIHKSWGIGVDAGIAGIQSQDAFDFIPAIPRFGGFADECVSEAMWFCLSQACLAFCWDVSSCLYIHEPVFQTKESWPSNERISSSMVVVRFDSLCVAHRVSM